MSDKEELQQELQEFVRKMIPKLKGFCFINEFLESVFGERIHEEHKTLENDTDKR